MFPLVIITFAPETDDGMGEKYAWAVANLLREAGIGSFLRKSNAPDEHDQYVLDFPDIRQSPWLTPPPLLLFLR